MAQNCNAYLFPQSVAEVSMATVHEDRVNFLRDGEGCPAAGSSCEGKAYLVAGDQVLIAESNSGYRCATFFEGKRSTTGWIASSALAPLPLPIPTGDWRGRWKRIRGDAALTIQRRDVQYFASAFTTYAVTPDNIRTGVARGRLHLDPSSASVAHFGEGGNDPGSCKVTLRRIGAWLLVNDGASEDANSGCGGMGVTFNGVYRHIEKTKTRETP